MMNFQQHNKAVDIQSSNKGVEAVEITLISDDVKEGQINITDLMLQGGSIATVWAYHPSEIRWSHDG